MKKKGCLYKLKYGMASLTISMLLLLFLCAAFVYGGDWMVSIVHNGFINRSGVESEARREEELSQLEHELEIAQKKELADLQTARHESWLMAQIVVIGLGVIIIGAGAVATWRLALGRTRSVREGWVVADRWASRQPVPETLTYAPHVHISTKSNHQALTEGQLPALLNLSALPNFTDLMNIPLPAPEIALLGLGTGGEPITNKWTKAKHIAIIGPTGGGKSVVSKTLIVQALRARHEVHILDPHFTRFDAETGEDWSPVTNRLKNQPATKVEEIVSRLKWVVHEMNHRLELRAKGEKYQPYICRIVLDEVPAIVEQDEEAAGLIARILREGRKVGVLLQMASQDMLAKTLGFKNGAAVRKNFSTAFIMRDCDTTSARLFVRDNEFKSDQLDVGIAAIVTEGQRGHVVARIPYTSNEAVERILSPTTAPTPLLTQLPAKPAIHQLSAPTAPISPVVTDKNTHQQRQTAADNSGSGSIRAIAAGGDSAKAIAFAIWDVNPDASHDAVMNVTGIDKRGTVRSYKTQWKKEQVFAIWDMDVEGSLKEPNLEAMFKQLSISKRSIIERYYSEWREERRKKDELFQD